MVNSRKEKDLEQKYVAAVSSIAIFPGSVAEYQAFRGGYEVEIIDTGRRDKGIFLVAEQDNFKLHFREKEWELRNHVVDNGIEAIVNAHYWYIRAGETGHLVNSGYYGLPVRKKKER